MSDWDDFLNLDNFKLGWQRILRSIHYENKDRIGLRVYEANLEANLIDLIDRLRQETYDPSIAENIYLPKRAGTVRRMSVLTIEDRLVYQAIANIIARKTKDVFEAITDKHVFAHLLNDVDSPFMLRRWGGPNGQYKKFLKRFEQLWKKGNHWLLESDIASYYDSIDHELLYNDLCNRWEIEERLLTLLNSCLRTWTAQEDGSNFSRGLPQGYQASDYLSTLFLLPADEQMMQSGQFNYIRYVDDIRILTSKHDDARQSLIKFDLALKRQALILQPAKGGFRHITDIKDEMDKFANKLSMIEIKRRRGQKIDQEAENAFFRSWHTLDTDKHAESRLVFALNRIPMSRPARDIALQMLKTMSWRSSTVLNYLGEFVGDDVVINALIGEITTHKVYAWHIANCITALAKIYPPDKYRVILQGIIVDQRLRWYQRLAAVEALQHEQDSYSFLFLNYSRELSYLVRSAMLVAAAFTASTDSQIAAVIRAGMKDSHPQVKATAVWLFLEFPDCGVNEDEFGPEMGVHRKMLPKYTGAALQGACYIETKLAKFFEVTIPQGLDFRVVFAPDFYDQAVIHLRRAFRYHDTDPVTFVSALDNLNHVISIVVSEKIEGRSIPRDKYGNMLPALNANHSAMSVHFLECHELRSKSRGPHPWASSLGTWSQDVNHQQKETLVQKLKVAYQHFVDVFAKHLGMPTPHAI